MSARPFNDDVAGVADANGNVTLNWRGMTGRYGSLLLIVKADAGAPSWLVNVNGSPVNVGRGLRSPLALPLLAPGDAVSLVGTGLKQGVNVLAHFTGSASDDPNELPIAPPQPSTIAMDVTSPQTIAGTVTALANQAPPASTFAVPIGTQTIGFVAYQSGGNVLPTLVQIVGAQTGVTYLSQSPALAGIQTTLIAVSDTSVTVSIQGAAGGPAKVDVLAWPVLPQSLALPVSVASTAATPARPFDWRQRGAFTNQAASLVAPASTGKNTVLAAYVCRVACNPATAYGSDLIWTDGLAVITWQDGVAVQAAVDAVDHANLSGLMVPSSGVGQSLTMALTVNPPANVFVDMAMGGYYV